MILKLGNFLRNLFILKRFLVPKKIDAAALEKHEKAVAEKASYLAQQQLIRGGIFELSRGIKIFFEYLYIFILGFQPEGLLSPDLRSARPGYRKFEQHELVLWVSIEFRYRVNDRHDDDDNEQGGNAATPNGDKTKVVIEKELSSK